jgi:uncharacterized membrane-anchored protein
MKILIDVLAVVLFAVIAVIGVLWPVATDQQTNIIIVAIAGGAVCGGIRYVLRERFSDT